MKHIFKYLVISSFILAVECVSADEEICTSTFVSVPYYGGYSYCLSYNWHDNMMETLSENVPIRAHDPSELLYLFTAHGDFLSCNAPVPFLYIEQEEIETCVEVTTLTANFNVTQQPGFGGGVNLVTITSTSIPSNNLPIVSYQWRIGSDLSTTNVGSNGFVNSGVPYLETIVLWVTDSSGNVDSLKKDVWIEDADTILCPPDQICDLF